MINVQSRSSESRRTHFDSLPLTSVCNRAKWERLRTSMMALERPPKFRTMDISGHYAPMDGEWYYHFRESYETRRFVDLFCEDEEQRAQVLAVLRVNQLSGHAIDDGFRVYGYTVCGEQIAKF